MDSGEAEWFCLWVFSLCPCRTTNIKKKKKCLPRNNITIYSTERDARTLFVKNLPFSTTADDLREVFEDAVDVRVPQGQNGSNRG